MRQTHPSKTALRQLVRRTVPRLVRDLAASHTVRAPVPGDAHAHRAAGNDGRAAEQHGRALADILDGAVAARGVRDVYSGVGARGG